MRISPLPIEVGVILSSNREQVKKTVEGPDGPMDIWEPGDPLPDAPTYFYKPLNPRERIRWTSKIFGEKEIGELNVKYLDLVDERLIRVENLEIGDEPFDRDKHMDSLETEDLVELGQEILTSASLSRAELGK